MTNRRDFLLLRTARKRPFVVQCDRLYMQYLDAIDELTTDALAERLERELLEWEAVQIVGVDWLAREDFRTWLDPVLQSLRERGVRVVLPS